MKKLLLLIFAVPLSLGVFAQDTTTRMDNMQQQKMKSHDGIMMKNGKMMVMENGQTSPLTEDRTLSNGTVVMSNGTVKMSDGTTSTLKEGEYVNMDGTMGMGKWKKGKMNKMKKSSRMSSDTLK